MRAAIAMLVVLAGAMSSSASAAVPPPTTELVSVSTAGVQGDADARTPSGGISLHGRYVAFVSAASNVVPGDTNGVADVFVRDRGTGTTERISASTGGAQADDASASGAISATGRYVAFSSDATNLTAGPDLNHASDVFRHDRVTGRTVAVSVDPHGKLSNLGADEPSISADGRYVAFSSRSTNLARDPNGATRDVFVRDMASGVTRLVSFRRLGVAADGGSSEPAISADGSAVVFSSLATNLVHHDTNNAQDVFERDLDASTTTRVSVSSTGVQVKPGFFSFHPATTADGRYVMFTSAAKNLVANDDNGNWDVFVHDMVTGTTELVSRSSSGGQGNGSSVGGEISDDGRYVAFWANANNLVPDDHNVEDIFFRDLVTGTTTRVDVSSAGAEADGEPSTETPALSGDGLHVAFSSWATNLVDGDTNGLSDVFVRNLG